MIMVGLHKMESRRFGSCTNCGKDASTICDRTGKQICPSCVTIRVINSENIEIRMVKK